jgi:NAD(P)-dependent dehydrogenase (short-subunit alcohol dehydrogenase family)
LVNNAGIGGSPTYSKNAAGHEMIFATNHLGHSLLTLLLMPFITDRIINVSSEVHDPEEKAPLPDPGIGWPQNDAEYVSLLLHGEPFPGDSNHTNGGRRYSRSKLCNVFYTNELAFRLSGAVPKTIDEEAVVAAATKRPQKSSCQLPHAKDLKVLAYNPGLMLDTQFFEKIAGSFAGTLAWLLTPLLQYTPAGRFLRSGPLSGGRLARIATGTLLADENAAFASDEKAKPSSVFSRSKEGLKYQEELWNHSIEWAGVTPEELRAAGW